MPVAGDGPCGWQACGGRLASVAVSVRYLSREVKKLFNKVRLTRRAKRHPERVAAYVARCRTLVERAEATLDTLRNEGVAELTCRSIVGLAAHARRQIDQVERRLLCGETIPHEEKVFSIFEGHTRWISKGKSGTPVELGVPVALIEDQYGFILHHKILWEGEDVYVAVPMVQERRHCIRRCGRAVSTAAVTAVTIGYASMHCSTSMRCRGKGIFEDRAGAGSGRIVCGRAACASGDRVCHQWVGASGTRPRSQSWCGGLRPYGCVVRAGGQPAPHWADSAEAGTRTTTTRRLTNRSSRSDQIPGRRTTARVYCRFEKGHPGDIPSLACPQPVRCLCHERIWPTSRAEMPRIDADLRPKQGFSG